MVVFGETTADACGITVTVTGAVLEQIPEYPVTEYVVVTVGATMIVVVVSPVLHKYVLLFALLTDAVKVETSPRQIIVLPEIYVKRVGRVFTVIVAVSLQDPEEAITV